jgi:hypothetical protein
MTTPRIEILYFEGCPNHEPARQLVAQIASELGLRPSIELVEVSDANAAAQMRFLGSPTVRVDGRDVEPGAEARTDFALSCRVYPSEHGAAGQPQGAWIRAALVEAGR